MGNKSDKVRHKKYELFSSIIRKYTEAPMVDINNSYELPGEGQILFIKIGEGEDDRAWMKILYLAEDSEEYSLQKSKMEEEWKKVCILSEHPHIIHYLGREYCTDLKNNRRCEILCQRLTYSLDKIVLKDIPRKSLFSWMNQIAQALEHTHKNGLSHGQLQLNNICIRDNIAVLKDFKLNKYTNANYIQKPKETLSPDPCYIPPEIDQPKKEFQASKEFVIYSEKKQDVYQWAVCFLALLGNKAVLQPLIKVKTNQEQYNLELKKVKAELETIFQSSEAQYSLLILACLKFNPLERPSFKYILEQIEKPAEDLAVQLRSLCHVCGCHSKRLHQLDCIHFVCNDCWKEARPVSIIQEEEKVVQEQLERPCGVCGASSEITFIALACGCKMFRKALEEGIKIATEEKIIYYDTTKKKYVFPSCENGHEIDKEDMLLLFGQAKMDDLMIKRRIEASHNR